nr:MAG TPA: hypothetical protein [Bacteriophage sp.]
MKPSVFYFFCLIFFLNIQKLFIINGLLKLFILKYV